ncbi:MAG TPA: FAD:protein FMN transferase [Candidimonas sp.]|nr:FAD:protein FMN transferase [Candidimonas sp.]
MMKRQNTTRRRFIGIFAAASGLAMTPLTLRHAFATLGTARQGASWRGIALGADAELHIDHPDAAFAQKLIDKSVAEVHRLERIFSLYQDDSALSVLNRQGHLDNPPADLLRLLAESQYFGKLTDGAFDPTVQPLWRIYAEHFAQPNADPNGPDTRAIASALAVVDYTAIDVNPERIQLLRPGMALTLNGIAQGYITDKIVQQLRAAGLDRALVDMGEIHGVNTRSHAMPWRVGLADPSTPGKIVRTIEIDNQALATSAGSGTPLDAAGRHTHIFNPKTGSSQSRYRSVTVMAAHATQADALSTAFSTMGLDAIEPIVEAGGAKAWVTRNDGSVAVLG